MLEEVKKVYIKGKSYSLEKNLQDFVLYTMRRLLENNAISEEELIKIQDKDYCKKLLNLDFPLLTKNPAEYQNDIQHSRYYAKETFFIKDFYLCNHWFKQDDLFSKWLQSLSVKS
ncbi:MAG: hypothetical protein K5829_00675 [Treponema sp.]|nr:hypothetical protein [Treponema sp.]